MAPTLGEIAASKMFPFVWVHCPLPCCHAAAIPMDALIARVGESFPTHELPRRARCVVCGRKGGCPSLPTWPGADKPLPRIPMDHVPAWAKALARRHG
jgi:hypothetical protein